MKKILLTLLAALLLMSLTACSMGNGNRTTTKATEAPAATEAAPAATDTPEPTATAGIEVTTAP